ncbi:MAG TPA: P-loop NTPase, partial [Paraburkholderia sp.]|uniref:P-loop NTPase n=1 Tax=Paraburkholderia sp. TaxID=1926495 RepID=UPI002B46AAAF
APGGQATSELVQDTGGSPTEASVKAVHFYGYKGGQGRSTVLLALAKTLAHAGYHVLAVDADIEAPSLDAMLNVAATGMEATLMGLSVPGTQLSPLSPAYVSSSSSGGSIDLVSARPVSARYDMDFAAFLLNASLDPAVLKKTVADIRRQVVAGPTDGGRRYDVVLFDHRTGLAPSVLPIMEAWPGPAVIFVRPDGMAQHIVDSQLLDTLLSHDPESPGAFVSFSLDPKKSAKEVRDLDPRYIDRLLAKIGNAMHLEEIDPDDLDLDPYWVFWRHDQNLVDGKQPVPSDMSSENRAAISQLRSVLGLSGSLENDAYPALTSSGSSDQGQFILTPGLAKLFTRESPYNYVFGRKGTGKTRLLSELVQQGFAEPLLVASDSRVGGILSAGVAFQYALSACDRDFEQFWWLLLRTALKVESTRDGAAFESAITNEVSELASSADVVLPSHLARGVIHRATERRRVFVIDGVETAVPATDLRSFIEALFRFLNTVQNDRTLSQLVTIRLFLRTDMATGAAENVEQQIEGSVIYLHWNKTAILNFALARIVSLKWFTATFPRVCEKIKDRLDKISRGALPDEEAESLLLEMFPGGLERNRLKTTTFFSAYFSDAGGESGGDAAFYPRLFDGFLRTLAHNCGEAATQNLIDGRISSAAVLQAYDQASRAFIGDVRAELYSLLNLDSDVAKNKDAVDRLIAAFDGMQTPFVVEDTITELADKVEGLPKEAVRQSIASMQRIGMFESRPKAPGELRARQLYKAGLGMKYVRGTTRGGRSDSQTVGDETRLSELEADLPSDIVLAISTHDFSKPLNYSLVERLHDFAEKWRSPSMSFAEKALQSGLRRLCLAVEALTNELAERTTFKTSDPSMIWVVPDHIRDHPNQQDLLDVRELNERGGELGEAYKAFLKGKGPA